MKTSIYVVMNTSFLLFKKNYWSIIFLLFLIPKNEALGQGKNSISITPLKVLSHKLNIHYERTLNNDWAAIADIQFWNVYQKGDHFLRRKKVKNTRFLNDGVRYTLGVRRYFMMTRDAIKVQALYIGLNAFIGKHNIGKEDLNAERYLFGERFPAISARGYANVISKGINVDLRIRNIYKKRFIVDFGFQLGRSWINREQKYYLVRDNDPSIAPKKQDFSKKIHGLYLEPLFSIGYFF